MLTYHTPISLIGGLTFLVVLLAGLRIRFGSVLPVIRQSVILQLCLAVVTGWLSAWIYLPDDFFPGPVDWLGYLLPGTLVGLLISVTFLANPLSNWRRVLILIWIGTVAHATIWLTGATIFGLLWELDFSLPVPVGLSDAIEWAIFGIPSGIVFGIILAVGAGRVLFSKFSRSDWKLILAVNAACGIVYVDVVMSSGYLSHLSSLFKYHTGVDGAGIYVAYVVWFVATSLLLARAKSRELAETTKTDVVLICTLATLTVVISSVPYVA